VITLAGVTPVALGRTAGALLLSMVVALGQPLHLLGAAPQEASIGANVRVPPYDGPFRFGINFGFRQGWNNQGLATASAEAGATSARIKLPEWLFQRYGYDSEYRNGNFPRYREVGLNDLTAFLIGPTPDHSTAPEQKNTELYSPRNLYEPIWSAPGVVNPENYWASYVYQAVTTYRADVRIWEIWNEPDYTRWWDLTQRDWWERPPAADELPYWNDSVFAYIRLLRVSYEVIKAVDPDALVATGGLGYESFLHAVLRYTDNPADGSLTEDFPARGGAYFDVLSFHYYPAYATQDLATKQWYRDTDSDSAVDAFATKVRNLRSQLLDFGYDGQTYPEKLWICTETGVASKPIEKSAGGPDLMRNYLAKLPIMAQASGVKQVHWFLLTDQEPADAASNSYRHMGLYYDLQQVKPGEQVMKPSALGYLTASRLLSGRTLDRAAGEALGLLPQVRGYVFRDGSGRPTYVLWARTTGSQEAASADVTLAVEGPVDRYEVAAGPAAPVERLTPAGGTIRLTLTGAPTFLVGQ